MRQVRVRSDPRSLEFGKYLAYAIQSLESVIGEEDTDDRVVVCLSYVPLHLARRGARQVQIPQVPRQLGVTRDLQVLGVRVVELLIEWFLDGRREVDHIAHAWICQQSRAQVVHHAQNRRS